MIKKYNITKPKKYTDKSGAEKTIWNQVGVMTEFYKDDGTVSRIIEIPAIGLQANVFPFQDQQNAPRQAAPVTTQQPPAEEIDVEAIPF